MRSFFDALQLCCRCLWHSCCLSICLSVCNGCIMAKQSEIEPELLSITNKKLHIGFQMTRKSSILGGLEGRYALLWLNGERSILDDLEGHYCNRSSVGQRWKWVIFCDPWPMWPIAHFTHDPHDPWPMVITLFHPTHWTGKGVAWWYCTTLIILGFEN